jgi:hypothetical protein
MQAAALRGAPAGPEGPGPDVREALSLTGAPPAFPLRVPHRLG